MWLHKDIIKNLVQSCKKAQFKFVEYGMVSIPTYPSGQIGILLNSKENSPKKPIVNIADTLSKEDLDNVKYYNTDIHTGCFALPSFVRSLVES